MNLILLKKIWQVLSQRRKKQIILNMILMIIASLMEVGSIGAIIPFLIIITKSTGHTDNEYIKYLLNTSDLYGFDHRLVVTLIFISMILFSGVIRFVHLNWQVKIAKGISVDLCTKIYKNMLREDYENHLLRSTSEIISGIQQAVSLTNNMIQPIMTIISSGIMLLSILIMLMTVSAEMALYTFTAILLIYTITYNIVKNQIKKNSEIIAAEEKIVSKLLVEGFGSFREITLNGLERMYEKQFKNSFANMHLSNGSNDVIKGSPRYTIETTAIIMIALMSYKLTVSGNEGTGILSIVGVLVFGAQRMMPLLQHIYSSYIMIKGWKKSSEEAIVLLELDERDEFASESAEEIKFNEIIKIKNIDFIYKKTTRIILNNVDIDFHKNKIVGITGKSGQGKSTLVDLVSGLIKPSLGEIIVDDKRLSELNVRAWRKKIGYVSQNIYLSDDTIAANIVSNTIEKNKFNKIVKTVQLHEYIESLPDKELTRIGERGALISGGQRQRVGIARALYRDCEVLILDEATSALDKVTEEEILKSIVNLGCTVIMITHREETLKVCDFVYEIKDGKVYEINI